MTVEVGTSVQLPCSSQGEPEPAITWNKVPPGSAGPGCGGGPQPAAPHTVLGRGNLPPWPELPAAMGPSGAVPCLSAFFAVTQHRKRCH